MMNDWKRIPRKLRGAIVQIANGGRVTMTEDTEKELLRREWIVMRPATEEKRNQWGGVVSFKKAAGWQLTTEGQKVYKP